MKEMCFVGCHKDNMAALSFAAVLNWLRTSVSDENWVIDLTLSYFMEQSVC